jgi:predicted site-specific integrase-resolvase
VRLSEWARREGVAYITAWRWWNEGKLPVPARKVGRLILVDVPEPGQGRTVVYARVSSADQEPDLDGQIARVVAWCGEQSVPVDGTVTEIGSALDGREKLLRLLGDQAVTTIVVEHRDRFARFGAEYAEAALAASGRRLLVAGPAEIDDDLVPDVTEILTCLCARRYGRRAAADRAAKALAAIESADA